MLTIPGLPPQWTTVDGHTIDLSVVPPGPDAQDDVFRYEKLFAWRTWRGEVNRYRAMIRQAAELNPELAALERWKCSKSPSLYFPTVYGWVYEPRHGGLLPAIPYPFQVEYLLWLDARGESTGADGNGAVSKSRDMGATWYFCLRGLGKFLFEPTYVLKLISRREDLVDDPGNMDSMIERIAANIAMIPNYLKPRGWDPLKNRQRLKITNPENKNAILGESTSSKSGRGGRCTEVGVDEYMFIDNLRKLLSALMQTAAHVFTISSESTETSEEGVLYREALADANPDSLFEMDYWLHPDHDDVWLALQRERYAGDTSGFAREILRRPDDGLTEFVYPSAKGIKQLDEDIAYIPGQPLDICLDPGFRDETAFHLIVGNYVPGRDLVLTSFEVSSKPPEFVAAVIMGCELDHRNYTYEDDPEKPGYTHPNDRFPDFGLSRADLADFTPFAAFMRTLSVVPTIYGDPAGSQKHVGESWYTKMITFSLKFNPRKDEHGNPQALTIIWSWKDADREDQGRRTALMNWLPRLDFNGNQQAGITLTAIQRSKWDRTEKPRQTEQKTPKHDAFSHRRSALEYGAVNIDFSRQVATLDMRPYIPSLAEQVA